jgi:ribonucleoside-diphosphate reductase alpha chain
MNGRYVPSLLAAIGEVIERHMIQIGFLRAGEALAQDPVAEILPMAALGGAGAVEAPASSSSSVAALFTDQQADGPRPRLAGSRSCPKCQAPTLIKMEGCDTCTSCGYSKCG